MSYQTIRPFAVFATIPSLQVASRAALDLLCRLLDVEKNKDAQLFLDAFTHSDKQSLKSLQLQLHILSDRGNRAGAFRLVSILREKVAALPVEVYVPDSWARQEYFRWAERNTEQGAGGIAYIADPQESFLKSLNLKDVSYKSIAEQAYADVYKTAQVPRSRSIFLLEILFLSLFHNLIWPYGIVCFSELLVRARRSRTGGARSATPTSPACRSRTARTRKKRLSFCA
jgi:hypothetical protein